MILSFQTYIRCNTPIYYYLDSIGKITIERMHWAPIENTTNTHTHTLRPKEKLNVRVQNADGERRQYELHRRHCVLVGESECVVSMGEYAW